MAQKFVKRSPMPATTRQLFDWHTRPAAFDRLAPPWEHVKLLEFEGIRDGQRAVIEMKAPFKRRWVAVHRDYVDGLQFRDEQETGPFARWEHAHRCEPDTQRKGGSVMVDDVTYVMPLGPLGMLADRIFGRNKIEQMFAHRHRVLRNDLLDHADAGHLNADGNGAAKPKLTIAITGASGLIGSRLRGFFESGGHTVRAVRRTGGGGSVGFNANAISGADAVIHLAGETISQKWTDDAKAEILRSRVEGTRRVCEIIASLPAAKRPKVLLSASAVGYYGSRGDEILDEAEPAGTGGRAGKRPSFLAEVCEAWEGAATEAVAAGVRVVHPRIGVVLTPQGGALKKMLPAFKAGVAGKLGDGRQWWPWVHIDDLCGIFYRCIWDDSVEGPVNVVAPEPVTNAVFTKTLGGVLRRPTLLPLPGFMVKLIFGQMGRELLLASQRVVPGEMLSAGHRYRHPDLEGALRALLGREPHPEEVPA